MADAGLVHNLVHNLAEELERARRELDCSLAQCPITREKIEDAVLASDGMMYERESLRQWLRGQSLGHKPYTSPVTRQPLRPEVVRCPRDSLLLAHLTRTFPSPNDLLVPRQTREDIALTHSGSALCKQWKTEVGVVVRMLLHWNDDDMIEWWFPIDTSGKCMTYASALPPHLEQALSLEIQSWLGLEGRACLVTAHFRKKTPGSSPTSPTPPQPFTTLEDLLLAAA